MSFIVYAITEIIPRAFQVLSSPWLNKDMIWIVLPLVVILLATEIYFGRYRKDEMGWNSAFGNSVSLLWICIMLFKILLENNTLSSLTTDAALVQKTAIVSFVTLWVSMIMVFEYFRIIPKKIAFIVSAADSMYPAAYIVISIVLGNVPLDMTTLYASAALYLMFLGMLYFIRTRVPPYIEKMTPN